MTSILASTASHACIPDSWTRVDGPVHRDKFFLGSYEVASDPHVFVLPSGQLAMIYSGDDRDQSSIKLAIGNSWENWKQWGVLLGPSNQPNAVRHKETSFYYLTTGGEHQIYFIGYDDEETYQAEIYRATAKELTGPWTVESAPVIPRGPMDGRNVYLMTSPSIVKHSNELTMVWLGWNGFDDVTEVWSFSATSFDDGQTWTEIREGRVPIGMEGQITQRPDGGYVAVSIQETDNGDEGVFAACAPSPEGPWTSIDAPLLTLARDAWEVDEIMAPSITYNPTSGQPYLYYTSVEHARGWRVMLAKPGAPD